VLVGGQEANPVETRQPADPNPPDAPACDVFDLSLPLDGTTPVYADPRGYVDPPTRVETWIDVGERRDGFVSPFRVSRLGIGAHTGTHLDAPAHFHPGGPTVSDLPLSSLVGRAVVCDFSDVAQVGVARDDSSADSVAGDAAATSRIAASRDELAAPGVTPLVFTPEAGIGPAACAELARLGPRLLVVAGPLDSDPDCPATSALLLAGLWIVTDVSVAAARQVRSGDLLIVAPLPLRDVEGAPCRVLAVRSKTSTFPRRTR
jgi:kynurenine formamidase